MSVDERMREFGAGLRRRRHAAGLDQATLAERMRGLGFPWYGSTVSKTEHGDRAPSLTELHGLAKVLDTDLLPATLDGEQTRAALAAAQATAGTGRRTGGETGRRPRRAGPAPRRLRASAPGT